MFLHKKKTTSNFEEPQSHRIQAAFCSIIATSHPFPLSLPNTPLFPPNMSLRIFPSAVPPLGFLQVTQVLVGNVLPPLFIHLVCSWALTWTERGPPIRAPCSGWLFAAPKATESKIWAKKAGFGAVASHSPCGSGTCVTEAPGRPFWQWEESFQFPFFPNNSPQS